MSSLIPSSTATSYWCYSCSRFVRAFTVEPISCPDCYGGFLELISNTPPASTAALRRNRTISSGDESFPAARRVDLGSQQARRTSLGHGSPFNPVIVLRSSVADAEASRSNNGNNSFNLFYDDGSGTGLHPLPQSMSNFLMGSGLDQLLDQLTQIENGRVGGGRSNDNTPASKVAIESLPTVTITETHIVMDSYCAVCTEALELGDEAQEMPCKHIFHKDCILPWLSLRNSCPVCRHELPADGERSVGDLPGQALLGNEENSSGLTIWRLPGGGFAVGRFSGVRRAGDGELPVVYSEMDRSLSSGRVPRGILWSSRGRRSREHRGVGRVFHNFFSMFRCFGPPLPSLSSPSLRSTYASEEPQS
ncbi:probable E3 ubiquitin-protein ligase RHC2A [Phalaenopsis equestris]|uniref:probable E3 ubiquitin-protein ligase RHC2A n=1 Tax=Phalaenopsis equestris TaxID=78828 RepID=UPI0009E500A5|nr:probable E3 ubiquitin-protein ligase RHC2A [Phalaenopsis equestris]